MDVGWFLIGSFVVWRLTHLFTKEDGPFDIVFRVRKKAGAGFFGSLLDCFYCFSIWTAVPIAIWLGNTYKEMFFLWFGFSGAACVIEKISDRRNDPHQPSHYNED
jgi:hypothetical protein